MEAIGTLAGSIAHDFNNLLSVILSYSEVLSQDLPSADPMRTDLEQISRAARRANDLTRQLLAFSRRQMLQPKVVNLNDAIMSMTTMLRRIIGEDIELTVKATRELGTVFVDPSQMEQVLLNLIVNARDAMPSGGKLTIETAEVDLDEGDAPEQLGAAPGRYVMLRVSDTGVGMDQATRARIFEPFFTTKERGKGTGLGLSTVFGIVKQSGGSIWVFSEPNRGTTFKIYLPRSDASAEPSERTPAPALKLRGTETVLLVEDDEQVRRLAETILVRSGYQVLVAPTGGDGLLICEQYTGTIHVLVTDVVMPRMSGRQLWERLIPLRPDLKVLFMSGYTDDAIVHHGVQSSELAFVQKPLLPSTLLAKLRAVLDAR
jgi:two-component system, cell cycle sensor histidine kinase and response regulator CckA